MMYFLSDGVRGRGAICEKEMNFRIKGKPRKVFFGLFLNIELVL